MGLEGGLRCRHDVAWGRKGGSQAAKVVEVHGACMQMSELRYGYGVESGQVCCGTWIYAVNARVDSSVSI